MAQNAQKEHELSKVSLFDRLYPCRSSVLRAFFGPSTAFFVDKAPACYYNSVVKMAFLCGFVAARKKYS
jgi:hypothetical protein